MASADRLLDALRSEGLRITAARRAVCAVLADSHGEHLSAADIHARANQAAGTSIDQSTVYRTLETLEEADLISHTHMGHQALVYHLKDEAPHQHIVCVTCGKMEAMPESELDSFFARITSRTGFIPDPTHVALSGWCAECAAKAGRSGDDPT
jgi:Fur family ferric uptake transcriptional regulator